jgi:hypothetical protein
VLHECVGEPAYLSCVIVALDRNVTAYLSCITVALDRNVIVCTGYIAYIATLRESGGRTRG